MMKFNEIIDNNCLELTGQTVSQRCEIPPRYSHGTSPGTTSSVTLSSQFIFSIDILAPLLIYNLHKVHYYD